MNSMAPATPYPDGDQLDRTVTRRGALGAAGGLLGALLMAPGLGTQSASAQSSDATPESTPASDPMQFDFLASGVIPEMPADPVGINLIRIVFAAGGRAFGPATPGNKSLVFNYIESGSLIFRYGAPVTVFRAATGLSEEIPANTEFRVGPGDSFPSAPAEFDGESRNDGTEPAVFLSVDLYARQPEPSAEGTPSA